MSVPGFLERQINVDFELGKEFERGGGGQVHLGRALCKEIQELTKSPQVVVKTICRTYKQINSNTLIHFD